MFSQKHAKISKFDRKVDLHGYHLDWAGAKTTETSSIQKAKSTVPKDSYFLTEVENFVEAEGRLVLEDKKLSTCENAAMSYHVSKPKKRKMKNWKGIRLGVFLSIFGWFGGWFPPKCVKRAGLLKNYAYNSSKNGVIWVVKIWWVQQGVLELLEFEADELVGSGNTL